MCRKNHGKSTHFYEDEDGDGEMDNLVFRNGEVIARKRVQAHEAFYTKEGKIKTADRADWKSFTQLIPYKEW